MQNTKRLDETYTHPLQPTVLPIEKNSQLICIRKNQYNPAYILKDKSYHPEKEKM